MTTQMTLERVAEAMVAPGKGILAADESSGTIKKRFDSINIFADAALTAPLTLDQREDKERFSLRIRIKQPMASRPLAKEEQQ